MSYPPYPPGAGAPGYPPGPGSTPYPSQPPGQPGAWVPSPGGMPAPGYPAPGPGFGFGSGPSYPPAPGYPPGPPSSGPAPYPGGPPGSGAAPYPAGPPPAGYPPSGPAPYPPGAPSSGYPPGPTSYPPGPPAAGGAHYPGGSSYPAQPPSSSSYPAQPPSGSAPYPSQPRAPVPHLSDHEKTTPASGHQGRAVAAAVHHVKEKMEAVHISKPETVGTVRPVARFDPEKDASTLRTAMKGFGTDEKAIIGVLAHRSNQQRQEIEVKFKTMFGRDLIKDFKSELSGHLEEVVLSLMMTPTRFSAYNLHRAIEGVGTDEAVLIEILCSSTNEEIMDINHQYKKDFSRSLEVDIRSDTSGHFRRLLVSMLTGAREPEGAVNVQKARQDAKDLYQAGEAKWGTDESVFNSVMCARSYGHLRVVFQEYSKLCRYDIEESISREMSGDLKEGMLAIVKCVRDKSSYFAEKLYKSMKGLGTDDWTLIRVMVSRCEVDMVQIKSAFMKKYRKSLESFIKGDTSGDYRRILLALAGE